MTRVLAGAAAASTVWAAVLWGPEYAAAHPVRALLAFVALCVAPVVAGCVQEVRRG